MSDMQWGNKERDGDERILGMFGESKRTCFVVLVLGWLDS